MLDLVMNQDSIKPLTTAGINYLQSVLSRGPVFPERDYQEALRRGLRVAFKNESVPIVDPVTEPLPWKPVDVPADRPDDYQSDEWPDVDEYPGDDNTLGE